MHHLILEEWSRRSSPLHGLDARAKLGGVVAFILAVSTSPPEAQFAFLAYAVLALAATLVSALPVGAILSRAALVLFFSVPVALLTWWSTAEPWRALALTEKSFLSAFAVVVLAGTTPFSEIAAALEAFRVPAVLVMVIQFLYRYLFVLIEQARQMRLASLSRSGLRSAGNRKRHFHAAAGALGVLFARSWQRAEGIHSAMLARGFRGHFPRHRPSRFRLRDAIFLCGCIAASVVIRAVL